MIKSLLLSLSLPTTNQEDLNEEIEEMKRLANTLGYSIEDSSIQNKQNIDTATTPGIIIGKMIFHNMNILLLISIYAASSNSLSIVSQNPFIIQIENGSTNPSSAMTNP